VRSLPGEKPTRLLQKNVRPFIFSDTLSRVTHTARTGIHENLGLRRRGPARRSVGTSIAKSFFSSSYFVRLDTPPLKLLSSFYVFI
jgi:hypothetical protein